MKSASFAALAALAFLAACQTPCPDGGRRLSITYVGTTVGTTAGSGALTLASDHGIDRLEVQSRVGDPGVKYATPAEMCELFDRFAQSGFVERRKAGRLVVGPGFEMRDGETYWNYTQPVDATLADFERFREMLGVFFEAYNSTFALQTVPDELGRKALESTQRATRGGN
jgi:hypothetical protein